MENVRVGVIGLGNMRIYHSEYLLNGDIQRATLTQSPMSARPGWSDSKRCKPSQRPRT